MSERRTVLITGGACGIGAATAIAFARAGYDVAIADILEADGNRVVQQIISDTGCNAVYLQADFAQASEIKRAVQESALVLGGLDVLFNNVGVQPTESFKRAEDTPEELWDKMIDINLKSHFIAAKYAIPLLRERGGGVIVNNASVQGLQSMASVPAYAASKGGVLSLTRQLAVDYADENIRVLAVCPGAIDTELLNETHSEDVQRVNDKSLAQCSSPMKRPVGTPADVADVVVFLASDAARFMTGEHVSVDGGAMALGSWAFWAGNPAKKVAS
ncbi:MAG: SDR family oxidoreductase [Roseitalea sp.]|jgi:NAD(P)-dependent dehydrogenase (short-subunit alcohol dehydrogenase family)|nr:SDR family oxidoreductase [Roseitalea sp.]MBO6721196.1 SDR family oxidoreductase [Roseitalea sp.]MBO6744254.1 SDR family oxidoreductase [Roseitalea sp.]